MMVLTGIISLYYAVIIAWTVYYFGMSFRAILPWSNCDNDWNTASCELRVAGSTNTSLLNGTFANGTNILLGVNATRNSTSPPEEFWK